MDTRHRDDCDYRGDYIWTDTAASSALGDTQSLLQHLVDGRPSNGRQYTPLDGN
jgi:hypothetical protein